MSLKQWIARVESEQLNELATPPGATAIPALSGQGNVSPAILKVQGNDPTLQAVIDKAVNDKKLVSVGNVTSPAQNTQQPAQQQKPAQGATMTTMQTTAAQQVQEEEMMEVAPPGMEDEVLALKKKFPGQEGRAYAIAWSQYNKKHGKKQESMNESMTNKQSIMEGTLEEILANHPHEHKMCQEGWGMDNSLYEALCDHYFKEGRIPRSIWHGAAEDLRKHVEECYGQDTMLVGEGLGGALAGGTIGAAVGGPVGALRGASLGSQAQDLMSDEEVAEGYHDLNDDGMQPIDFSTNPNLKSLMNRHSQLYYQGMEDSTTDEEMAEQDAIEAYTLKNFGQKGLDHLNKATQTNFWGRDDKPFGRDSRSSNLGRPSQPTGDFRTTKAGKMYGQDVKTMKGKIADRLGSHPEPVLPEGSKEDFRLDALRADPKLKRYATDPKPSKFGDMMGKIGGAVKKAGSSVMDKLHPSDEKLRSGPIDEESELEHSIRSAAMEKVKKEMDETMYEGKKLNEKDLGKHNNATTGFKALAKKTGGGEKGAKIAGAQLAKMRKSGQIKEDDVEEGNEFTGNLAKAKAAGKSEFTVDGKKYKVKEATEKTKTGLKHKADPGGYGRKHEDDEDEIDDKTGKKKTKAAKKAEEPKKGRGRPKKVDAKSGEDKSYDFSAFGVTKGKDVKLPKWDKKKTTSHKIATKADRDEVTENWDRQLKSLLKEGFEVAAPVAAMMPAAGQQSPVPQQDDAEHSDILSALKALLNNAGMNRDVPANGGDDIDGTELQSGVDAPVNDKNSEPGSDDPRNDTIAGQVFVPQLAMPRGMGMSVEGDVHTHEIDIKPAAQDEIIVALANGEQEHADQDDGSADLDFIKRLLGDRNSGGKAKLIVPAGDYAQEVEGSTTSRDHTAKADFERIRDIAAGDHNGSIDDVVQVGEDGDIEEDAEPTSSLHGPMHGSKQETFAFGHNSDEPVAENAGDPEGAETAFGHDAEINAADAVGYKAGAATTNVNTIDEEALDQPATMEDADSASSDDMSRLMSKLDKLLGMVGDDAEVEVEIEKDDSDEESDTESDEEDDAEEETEKLDEDDCNECGLAESKCECDHEQVEESTDEYSIPETEELKEWANTPQNDEDEQFTTEMEYMTKLLSGGLNNMKRNQTTLPSTQVTTKQEAADAETSMAEQLRKLAGIN